MERYYLAIDIGASSGRHMLGHIENGKMILEEIWRFENGMKDREGSLCWDLDALFEEVLEQNNVWQQAVQKICSIDLKKEEPGLLLFCAEHGILLETYDAETLRNLDGEFTASAFVSQVTGVDNVCERSAMAGSQNGKILISKMAKNGVTAAFVLDEVKISF